MESPGILQQVIGMTFLLFSLAGCGTPPPTVINHAPPESAVDFDPFPDAGCEYGPQGGYQEDSLLAILGCQGISRPSDLLGALAPSYPIAACWVDRMSKGAARGFGKVRHPDVYYFRYVIFRDGQFVPLRTEEEFQGVFAPIETADEALSYAYAIAEGRGRFDGPLRAYYGLELDSNLEYYADVIEDTHVDAVADGYLVHLFHLAKWCSDPNPITYAVDIYVASEGHVKVSSEAVWEHLDMVCFE